MPHASHRLDLLLVPTDPERAPPLEGWEELRARWSARGWLEGERPGPSADALIPGGFARAWLSVAHGQGALYANQQGGFRPSCPRNGEPVARALASAVQAWVEGGPRRMRCPACGEEHPLEELRLAPPGAFGRFALAFAEVSALELAPRALAEAEGALGPLRTVLRRVS